MKHKSLFVLATALTCSLSSAIGLNWSIGGEEKLMINGELTTKTTFNSSYQLQLMHIGNPPEYTEERGYDTFVYEDTGVHQDTPGEISQETTIEGGTELSYNEYLIVLYEIGTGKYYFISETPNGESIDSHDLGYIFGSPAFDFPQDYFPESSTGYFYKGAEIPPFCGWLASKGLVQSALSGLNTNLVNKAFAVNANPTNFNDIALAITTTDFAANPISGAFTFKSYDAANNPTTVTKLNGSAALSLISSTSLAGAEAGTPASFNLPSGTFQTSSGATNATQFLRLKLCVPDVW